MSGLKDIKRKFKEILKRVQPGQVGKLFGRRSEAFRTVRVEDLPDAPRPLLLYIAGEIKQEWAAAMLCPCGCGETIRLNLLEQVRPRWKFLENETGPSLEPSVWRRQGCRSHFFLRDGRIEWCDTAVSRPRKAKRKWFN